MVPGRDLGRGVAALSLQLSWENHGREGDAVAFNEDGARWCDIRETAEELSLQGFNQDIKHGVTRIKNMLGFLHL